MHKLNHIPKKSQKKFLHDIQFKRINGYVYLQCKLLQFVCKFVYNKFASNWFESVCSLHFMCNCNNIRLLKMLKTKHLENMFKRLDYMLKLIKR